MDSDRAFKDAIYEQITRIGKALAHPRRLELLDLLCQGPMTVELLARKSSMSVANASQHLQHLKQARLVSVDRKGASHVYRLADEGACELIRSIRSLAEQYYAEIRAITDTFVNNFEALETVDLAALQRRMAEDAVVLLDVRPPDEYAAGHLPGAISLPLEDLADRLAELPRDRTIVAYCRGPYCVLALHAVDVLRRHGFRAVRLADSVADWRAQGLPVIEGSSTR